MSKTLLVTGSSGLIGSEVCVYFAHELGFTVHGVDNNQRAVFFGPQGDTRWNQQRLAARAAGLRPPRARHPRPRRRAGPGRGSAAERDRPHRRAAQPRSRGGHPVRRLRHQRRRHAQPARGRAPACPESPFVHMCTNKVYGDAPNHIPLRELETRWDYADPAYAHGIPETFSIDQSKHSLFGASKVAADVMVQEYGRYFGMPTCCLRGGCLTGPNHSRRRAARLPQLPREVQPRGARVQGVRLQGQTGARQHPLARRRPLHGGVCRRAARRRGLQPRRRQGQLLLDPRGVRASRRASPARRRSTPTSTRTASATTSAITRDLRKMRAHYPDVGHHSVADDDHPGIVRVVAPAVRVIDSSRPAIRLACLYIGDVAVADTFAGEALLFRLLRPYPPGQLAIVCEVRRGMPTLPDVAYHEWSPLVPRLLHSRVLGEVLPLARLAGLPGSMGDRADCHSVPRRGDPVDLSCQRLVRAWQIPAARGFPLTCCA